MNSGNFTQCDLDGTQCQRRLRLKSLRLGGFSGEEYVDLLHAYRQTRHLLAVIQRQQRTAKLEANSHRIRWSKIW